MFVVDVKVDINKAKEDQLKAHLDYCHQEFEKGNIVMCGPSVTYQARGIIIFKAKSQEELQEMLLRDPLYNAASYDVHKFRASAIAQNIKDY